MKEERKMNMPDRIVPVRLDVEQVRLLAEYRAQTGLSRNFIIRRCINYALQNFISGQVNVLTLEKQE